MQYSSHINQPVFYLDLQENIWMQPIRGLNNTY